MATVLKPPNVIAPTGLKQVQKTVSAERGELVTMVGFISATGSQIPPVFIYPRVNFKNSWIENGLPGCIGLANRSGWQTGETFLKCLKHFVDHTHSSPNNLHLLILDNHSSHIDAKCVSFAKENGLILLTFPPHCSNRMQPLNVGLFGPFKSGLITAFDDWMATHPSQRVRIDNIAPVSQQPYLVKFNPANIASSFQATGIWPFDRHIFKEADFLPSLVTDREIGKSTSINLHLKI